MNEQGPERPLTRRERRLQEQANEEVAAADVGSDVQFADDEGGADQSGSAYPDPSVDIEIDPLNPDGSLRTRRELRQLREAALAELAAASVSAPEEADTAAAEDAPEGAEATEAAEVTEAAESADDAEVTEAAEAAAAADDADGDDDYDESLGAPTEAFSLEDLLEAVEPTAPTGDEDAVAALFADADADTERD